MKLKKSLIILPILLVAGIIAMPLIDKYKRGTIKGELKDFAVKDINKVDRIFMSKKNGAKVELIKNKEGKWLVNNKYPVTEDKLKILLEETLPFIEVKAPVSDAAYNNVVTKMASSAIKVEIYEEGDLSKTYYVGGTTADELGTFMYMEGSTRPFICHIPGFKGYLSARFELSELRWRSKNIFNAPVNELKSVEVNYLRAPENSFKLIKSGNEIKMEYPKLSGNINQQFIKQYSALFGGLYHEGFVERASELFVDSLSKANPEVLITVVKTDGLKTALKVYKKPVTQETKQQFDEEGNPLDFDTDRYYALIDNNKELIMVQEYVFRNVFKAPKDFY